MIRLAGLGVAVLLFLGVAAGFRSDLFGSRLAEGFAALGFAAQPVFLGLSVLEWLAAALAGALVGGAALSLLRRRG